MSINSLSVANVILDEAEQQGISVTPMQLQKLVYFTNGWHMEIYDGKSLVSDNFEAWQFGPVMPVIYHEFKRFGSRPVNGRALNPFEGKPWSAKLSAQQISLVREIVRMYGKLSGPRMSHLTHKSDTPWSLTWKNGVGSGNDIPRELILAEFRKIRKNSATAA
jgi:uncharacterized phage-associated protein